MARFTYPDGRWVSLRPMYVDDELAFADLASAGEELDAAVERIAAARAQLTAVEHGTDEAKAAATDEAVEAVTSWQRAYNDRLRAMRDRMADACEATSWDGPLGARVTAVELGQLARRWRLATEDETLPPV